MAEDTTTPQEQTPGSLIAVEGRPDAYKPKVSDSAKKALQKIVKDLAQRDRTARRQEVWDARKGRYYYRGDTHLGWDADNQTFFNLDGGDGDKEDSEYTFNIYLSTGRSIISALSQSPPGCTFEPQKPNSPTDQDAASAANALKTYIETNNDAEALMAEVARLLYTDGRTAIFSRYVTDGQEFGFSIDADGKRVPLSGEKIDAFGVLEVSCPIAARSQKQFPWLNLSYEIDINEAKAMVGPELADKLSAAGSSGDDESEGSWERFARLAVQSGVHNYSTGGYEEMITFSRTWLRPSAFMACKSESDRAELIQSFPDGALVSMFGDTVSDCCNESMDAHWTILHPMPSDGQNSQSLGNPVMPFQESLDDLENSRLDSHMYGGAVTWVDDSKINIDAINEQRSKPGAHLPIKRDQGESIANYVYEQKPVTISPDLNLFQAELTGPLLAQVSAVTPSLNGAGDPHNETAQGQAIAKESSLAGLGLTWRAIKKAYANVMAQAVKCATNRTEDIETTVPGGKETITICIEDLRAGNFKCSPDTDDSHPQTWSQKKASLTALMGVNDPAITAVLSSPANLPIVRDLLGFPDLKIDGADEALKQKGEIAELLKTGPIPDVQAIEQAAQQYARAVQQYSTVVRQAAAASQQPPPPPQRPDTSMMVLPSVPIDIDWDAHDVEYGEVRSWINSPAGQAAKAKNPDGFKNVQRHGMAHKKAMEDQAAQNAGAPPQKPVSVSLNYRDLPPEGQAQLAAEAGIQIRPPTPVAPPTALPVQ